MANDYAGTVPANSIVEITDYTAGTGVWTVDRPARENSDLTMVTDDNAIPNGGTGKATFYGPAKVTVDDDGVGELWLGDYVGAQTDDFVPLMGNVGWQMVGIIDDGPSVFSAMVMRKSIFATWLDEGE